MDFLRRIEDDVRNLGVEVKKKYPEVKDATDRALVTLKTMRESYVSEIMRSPDTPKIAKYRSADVSAPYILACNYVDANQKTIMLSLNGLQMLLNYEVVPPSEAKNILRVLAIQGGSGRSEVQLKVLQIVLQLANSLAAEVSSAEYLTESNVCGMMQLALQLCDPKNSTSVSSTAFATARQMVALVMDTASEVLVSASPASSTGGAPPMILVTGHSGHVQSSMPFCAIQLVHELSLFLKGLPGEWMKGLTVAPAVSLDLLFDIVSGWKHLFHNVDKFRALLKHPLGHHLKGLLKNLREDYILAFRQGSPAPGALTYRTVRLARCLLVHFLSGDFSEEAETMISLMVHTLQPERGLDLSPLPKHQAMDFQEGVGKFMRGGEEAQMAVAAGMGMAQSALSRLANPKGPSFNTPVGAEKRPGALGGNFLVLGPQGNNLLSGGPLALQSAAVVVSHPAGICLEALLSLLISDRFMERMLGSGEGEGPLVVALTSIAITVSALLSEGTASEANMRDFELTVRGSSLVTLVEGVLIGAESDVDAVGRSLHDQILNCGSVTSAEVLVLAFQVSQILARILVRCALQSQAKPAANAKRIFISQNVLASLAPVDDAIMTSLGSLRKAGAAVCDRVFECQLEACTALLHRTEEAGAIRRCLGVISEWALASGLLGLQRPTDVIIATLCRFTVPRWHGNEMVGIDAKIGSIASAGVGPTIGPSGHINAELFRWRHLQAAVRLLQVVHVLSDVITDYESVMDCFEQLIAFIGSPKSTFHEDVTALELEKIGNAIERFKAYSIFLSDEALVRVMASLVALSLNSLAVSASSASANGNQQLQSAAPTSSPLGIPVGAGSASGMKPSSSATLGPPSQSSTPANSVSPFQTESASAAVTSFSLLTAVEVTKVNAYRMACVWQLMTSHLRMVAAHRVSAVRLMAVHATHDVISKTLEYMKHPVMPPENLVFLEDDQLYHLQVVPESQDANQVTGSSQSSGSTLFLSDALLFNGGVFQFFETVFSPRQYQRNWLVNVDTKLDSRPQLGQEDLLGSLKALAIITHADVRVEIVQGLLTMLQAGGSAVSGGWGVVIELLTAIAASMTVPAVSATGEGAGEDILGMTSSEEDSEETSKAGSWPRTSLAIAFSCMTLIVDDFLEALAVPVIRDVIHALSVFSSQVMDVNISLTSVEMLWKVSDFIMTISKQQGDDATTASVLQFTMSRLLMLCTDTRPEIRNCATNTLFSAMAANAQLLSASQWQVAFDDVVFPLFTRSEALSNMAMMSNEEAIAPELKKGVKMAVHHSRDTAHKQWSETRVLALRGIARLFRACTKYLLSEGWFKTTWQTALGICVRCIQSSPGDSEVSLAAVDALFTMLKTVAAQAYKAKVRATRGMRVVGGTLVEEAPSEAPIAPGGAKGRAHIGHDKGGKGAHSEAAVQDEEMTIHEAGARESLWNLSWTSVRESVSFDEPSGGTGEVALHMTQHLRELFGGGLEGEFRYSSNVKNLLEMVVVLARPRMGSGAPVSIRRNSTAEIQLQRSVMSLLRDVKPSDPVTLCCLVSALSELCFAVLPAVIRQETTSVTRGDVEKEALQQPPVQLNPVDDRMRTEAGEYLISILDPTLRPSTAAAAPPTQVTGPSAASEAPIVIKGALSQSVAVDVITARFATDLCDRLLQVRRNLAHRNHNEFGSSPNGSILIPSTPVSQAQGPTSSSMGGFLSSIGKMLSASTMSTGSAPVTASTVAFTPTKSAPEQRNSINLSSLSPGLSISTQGQGAGASRQSRQFMGMSLHRLDHLKSNQTDTTHVADVSKIDGWYVFPVPPSAVLVFSSALRVAVAVQGLGTNLSDQVWSQAALGILSAMSPWRLSELGAAGFLNEAFVSTSSRASAPVRGNIDNSGSSSASETVGVLALESALTLVVSGCIEQRARQTVVQHLIDVLEIASRLSVHALASSLQQLQQLPDGSKAGDASSDPSASIGSPGSSQAAIASTVSAPPPLVRSPSSSQLQLAHQNCLETLRIARTQLESICTNTGSSKALRQRSLQALIQVAQDLANAVVTIAQTGPTNAAPSPVSPSIAQMMRSSCCDYFQLIRQLPVDLELLPSTPSPPPSTTLPTLAELYELWSTLVNNLGNMSSESPSSPMKGGSGGQCQAVGNPQDAADSESEEGSDEDGDPRRASVDSEAGSVTAETRQASSVHILLVTPHAIRILASCTGDDDSTRELRSTVLHLLTTPDFHSIVHSYRAAVTDSRAIRLQNRELQEELLQVRSAASLPF